MFHFKNKMAFLLQINILSEIKKLNGTSVVAQMVKNLPTVQETWVQALGWEWMGLTADETELKKVKWLGIYRSTENIQTEA